MHSAELPQFAKDSAIKRRGRLHLYENIDPACTALVVIDMQNMFLQEGAPAEVPMAREIIPDINRLAAATRSAGGTVVWVQMTQTESNRKDWSVFYNGANHPERPERALACEGALQTLFQPAGACGVADRRGGGRGRRRGLRLCRALQLDGCGCGLARVPGRSVAPGCAG